MTTRKPAYLAILAAGSMLLAGAAFAQTPTPPQHHGLLSFLHRPHTTPMQHTHPHPTYASHGPGLHHSMNSGHSFGVGQFIGNKRSHVFHLPGDKGTLPAPQNRVYFKSAAAAEAAGYHQAR